MGGRNGLWTICKVSLSVLAETSLVSGCLGGGTPAVVREGLASSS